MMHARAACAVALGPVLWCGWFVALYALRHLYCLRQVEADSVRLSLLGLTAAAVLLSAALAFICRRHAIDRGVPAAQRFAATVAAALHLVSVLSMTVIVSPVMGLPPCG